MLKLVLVFLLFLAAFPACVSAEEKYNPKDIKIANERIDFFTKCASVFEVYRLYAAGIHDRKTEKNMTNAQSAMSTAAKLYIYAMGSKDVEKDYKNRFDKIYEPYKREYMDTKPERIESSEGRVYYTPNEKTSEYMTDYIESQSFHCIQNLKVAKVTIEKYGHITRAQ